MRQLVVLHVGDLCAEPVPSLAHALDAIERLGRGLRAWLSIGAEARLDVVDQRDIERQPRPCSRLGSVPLAMIRARPGWRPAGRFLVAEPAPEPEAGCGSFASPPVPLAPGAGAPARRGPLPPRLLLLPCPGERSLATIA